MTEIREMIKYYSHATFFPQEASYYALQSIDLFGRFMILKHKLRNTIWVLTLLLTMILPVHATILYTLSGIVKDATSRETLPGVTVRVDPIEKGAITNIGGFYCIQSLPPGDYTVRFTYIGYTTITKQIAIVDKDLILNQLLQQSSIERNVITVEGEREKYRQKMTVGEVKLSVKQLMMVPKIAEPDLFRTLQLLPGVLSASDFSTGLNVWGGSPDQNLITLDGIDVYNPSHLGGLFSTFNMDAIKEATLIKGAYPAEYGGRLSSVLSVWNREGNRESFQGKAQVSVLSSAATLEGPIPKGSWLLSGRRTYIDLFTKAMKQMKATDTEFPYYFYDAQTRVNRDLANGDRLSVSGYFGRDVLDYKDDYDNKLNLNWGNRTGSVMYTKIFSPHFYSQSLIAISQYDSKLDFDANGDKFSFSNGITDYTAKMDVFAFPGKDIELKFGHESKYLMFYLRSVGQGEEFANVKEQSYLGALYLQTKYTPTPLLSIQPGIRYNYFQRGNYSAIEPRISIKYRTSVNSSITAAFGHYQQFINLASIGGGSGFLSVMDIWAPVDKTLKPGKAEHYTMAYETELTNDIRFETEAYYKNYNHMVEFKNIATEESDLKSQFYEGRGWAWGLDITLRKDYGDWTGWIGYGLGFSKRQFPAIDSGRAFYPKWDKRNTFNLVNTYRTSKRGELSVRWTYSTGQPYTLAAGYYRSAMPNDADPNRLIPGRKNNARLAPYHRLDVGYTIKYEKSWGTISPYFEVINLYNRANVFTVDYDFKNQPPKKVEINQFPFLPTFGVTATF